MPDRDALDASQGDISKVQFNLQGNPETFIYNNNTWKTLVEVPSGLGGTNYTKRTEVFEITQLEEDFQEIHLLQIPTLFDHLFVYVNGLLIIEGASSEFTRIGNAIQFSNGVIYKDDIIQVKYSY